MARRKKKDDLAEMLEVASFLPDGPVKMAIYEEAVRRVDEEGDLELAYQTRQDLLDVAVSSGRGDLLLTHFAWCLAHYDKNRDQYNDFDILWRYKWVTSNVVSFPTIPLKQIEALTDDMERRFQEFGAGQRSVADQRYSLARHRGDKVAMKELYAEYRALPRDILSNCNACEADDAVDYYAFLGQYRRAVQVAKPITEGGLSCMSVPERTYARLLVPLFRLGEMEAAANAYRIAYRLSSKSGDATTNFGRYMTFLALTGNLAAGMRILQRAFAPTYGNFEPLSRYHFYAGALFLLEEAVQKGLKNKIRVPDNHPLAQPKGVPLEEFQNWLQTEVESLATQFDERNGNEHIRTKLRESAKMHKKVIDYPIAAK